MELVTPRKTHAERELDRLWRLARSHDVWRARGAGAGGGDVKSVHLQSGETVGWREVLLGRRFDTSRTEELDRKDLEKGACLLSYHRG